MSDTHKVIRILDLEPNQIVIGLRIKSLVSDKLGKIVQIDNEHGDMYSWILWDGDNIAYSGFYGNDCKCEVKL